MALVALLLLFNVVLLLFLLGLLPAGLFLLTVYLSGPLLLTVALKESLTQPDANDSPPGSAPSSERATTRSRPGARHAETAEPEAVLDLDTDTITAYRRDHP